ncbi:hypothetical protein BLAT2472_60170 [Burkholderia latens]
MAEGREIGRARQQSRCDRDGSVTGFVFAGHPKRAASGRSPRPALPRRALKSAPPGGAVDVHDPVPTRKGWGPTERRVNEKRPEGPR